MVLCSRGLHLAPALMTLFAFRYESKPFGNSRSSSTNQPPPVTRADSSNTSNLTFLGKAPLLFAQKLMEARSKQSPETSNLTTVVRHLSHYDYQQDLVDT